MPSAVSPNPRTGSTAADDLFNYDDAVEDFLKDLPLDKDQQNNHSAAQEPPKDIDEEVTIRKKRKPVPKLDEARLLSEAGIPRLRKISKRRLKFRGKGHEFSDMLGLLNTYQLWLDDLYPRAKFRDALSMLEKVGHSKRMQVTRKAWLDATKPYQKEPSPERVGDVEMSGALPGSRAKAEGRSHLEENDDAIFKDSGQSGQSRSASNAWDEVEDVLDDDLDALLAEDTAKASEPARGQRGPFEEDEGPDDDELDALLAEPCLASNAINQHQHVPGNNAPGRQSPHEDRFADEEEVMAGMGDLW